MTLTITCPTCQKRVKWDDNPWRPFCSERCKLIDLGEWANESHRIPGEEHRPIESENEDDGYY